MGEVHNHHNHLVSWCGATLKNARFCSELKQVLVSLRPMARLASTRPANGGEPYEYKLASGAARCRVFSRDA